MKKLLIGGGAVVAFLVVLLVVGPTFVDWNRFKPEFSARVEAATGRKLTIDGDISVRLLPTPVIAVDSLRVANLPGGTAEDMAVIAALEVRISLAPLLRRELAIRSITLIDPVIELEVLADGRRNWAIDREGVAQSAPSAAAAAPTESKGGSMAIWVGRARIDNGALTYRDATTGQVVAVDKLNARLEAGSPEGPFAADGSLVFRGVAAEFELTAGVIAAGQSVPLTARLALASGRARVRLQGAASEANAAATFSGSLEASGDDLGVAWSEIARVWGGGPAALAVHRKFALRAALSASAREVGLNDLAVTIGKTTVTGALGAALSDQVRVDVALAANRIDLDAWLDSLRPDAEQPAPTPSARPPDSSPAPPRPAFAVPGTIIGSASLRVDALVYHGKIVRQLQADATLADGTVTVRRVSALLPGGSDLRISGKLAAERGQPQFDGALEVASDNLRAALEWLGVDTHDVPADRLRTLLLTATVQVTPVLVQVNGIDLRLDASRLTGGIAYALRSRPSFGADIAIDRLNLDAYLKPVGAARASSAASGENSTATAKLVPAGLGVFDRFDTDTKLRIGALTANKMQLRDLRLDMHLLNGELTVRSARASDLAGASVAVSGTATGFSKQPRYALKLEAQARDASGLLRLADITPPKGGTGPVSARGSVSGSDRAVTVDVTLGAAASDVRLVGTLGEAAANLSVAAKSPDLAALLARIAPDVARHVPPGAAALNGSVKGNLSRLDIDLKGTLAQAQFAVAGNVAPLAGPTYAVAVKANHPNLENLLGTLGADYKPAAVNLGGVGIAANVVGEPGKLRLGALKGSVGPVNFEGSAEIGFGGPRPKITADLRASEILLDLFMPRPSRQAGAAASDATAAPSSRAARAAPRWSNDPVDLGFLSMLDADIRLRAVGLIMGAYAFAAPSVSLVLRDGTLTVDPLSGKLFGGDVTLTARLANPAGPRAELAVSLAGADLAEALQTVAAIDTVQGGFGLTGQFTTAGRSQLEMVSNLQGGVVIEARHGRVRGIDLNGLSERLKRLNEITDYIGLITASLSGGASTFSAVDASFTIADGVARTSDVKALFDAASGEGQATIDLPRWLIDANMRFRLTEHAKVPPVGLELSGPLDAPRRTIRSRDLEAYLAQRVTGAVLRKALGKDNPLGALFGAPAGRAPQGGAQPPDDRPRSGDQPASPAEQILRGLGGLLGSKR